jgi:hypothetical protein
MIHKLIAVAAWTLLAFIAYATISPIQARPTLFASPSFERLAAFTVLGVLFLLSLLQSTYDAAANAAKWDRDALECAPGQPGLVRQV